MNQSRSLKQSTGQNILIVDDDPDTCALLEALFRVNGYNTKVVYNSREAVSYVETNAPDIVILDVMMPEVDGLETFTNIRSHSNVPVIFLTASTSGDCASQALRLGGSDFMRKPYSPQELLTRIEIVLKNARLKEARLKLAAGQHHFKRDMAITVVIPAYNEARFIGSTVLSACAYADTVIVVDDGSRDNTADIAETAGAVVVRHDCNNGKGAALNTGFRKAKELGAQVVVMLDADGQHLPEELDKVVEPVLAGEADIVIGSRYITNQYEVPRQRVWGHWFFNRLTNLTSGVASTDSQSGYRAFSPAALEKIDFHSNGFSVESEMQFIAHELGLRLVEVPVTIRYLDRPKRSAWAQGMSVLNGVLRLTGQYRPLFFIGLPGFILLCAGVALGLVVVERYIHMHALATGYAIICMLLMVSGLLMLTTGVTLHSIRGLLLDLLADRKN